MLSIRQGPGALPEGRSCFPQAPSACRWAPVSALVSFAAALPGGDMSVASMPHCRMAVLLFPGGRRENSGFEFCHQDHRNSSPPVLSREQIVMSSAEAFVVGMKLIVCDFTPMLPMFPQNSREGRRARGCNFITTESPAPQIFKPCRCWSAVCAGFHHGIMSRSRQAAIKIN